MSKAFSAIFMATLVFAACSKDDGDSKNPSPKKTSEELTDVRASFHRPGDELRKLALETNQILVLDENDKPAQVSILFGTALGQPTADNILTTDTSGLLPVPSLWTTALPITLTAPGYVRATYLAQSPSAKIFRIQHLDSTSLIETAGQTTGIAVPSDGKIDFALVLPSLSKQDLLQFDISEMISPLQDQISVAGNDVPLPSNVALPTQRESYFFVPFEISKPIFRSYSRQAGTIQLTAVHGQFSVGDAIGAFKSKDPVRLLNIMQFQSTGTANANAGTQSVSLPATQQSLAKKVSVQTPNVLPGQTILGLSLTQTAQGRYILADIKATQQLTRFNLASSNGDPLIAFVSLKSEDLQLDAMTNSSKKFSAGLFSLKDSASAKLLNLPGAMKIQNAKNLQITAPAIKKSAAVLTSFASLSQIMTVKIRGESVKINRKIWEVYAPTWLSAVHLPDVPNDQAIKGQLRWDFAFLTAPKQDTAEPLSIEDVDHVSYTSQEFAQ